MATLVGKPQASNSEGLAGLSTPVTYSKATGLALQLANMLASAGQVVPFMRKLTPAQFTSGTYDGTKPDGYTPAAYKLSMLEMPETIAVYDDVLKVCQPVMVYQVGTPTQLITADFPITLQTGNFTIGGQTVPAVNEGQSVLLRFYKNANIKINWAGSNITNNGLTDDVITTTTELAFVVTYLNGAYEVTEWLSPDFITSQLSTLKTAKKNNFASVINELFDKIPAPVTLPTYDPVTLKLASNILSVILAPQANASTILNNAVAVVDFSEGFDTIGAKVGETCIFTWGPDTPNGPTAVTTVNPGIGIAMVNSQYAIYALAIAKVSGPNDLHLWLGHLERDGSEPTWLEVGGNAAKAFTISDFKNVSTILAQLEANEVAAIYSTGSSILNGPTGTSTFSCLGTIQKSFSGSYVQCRYFVTNVAGGTDLASYVGVLCSNSTYIKWTRVSEEEEERTLVRNWTSGFSSSSGTLQISTSEVVNIDDTVRIQGQLICGEAEPATAFDVTGKLVDGGLAVLTNAAYRWDEQSLAILIFEYAAVPGINKIQLRWFFDTNTMSDFTELTIRKITKIGG